MKLANLITQVRGVSYKTSNIKNVNDGIPILRANNINDNNINFNDLIYIDKTKISEKQYLKVGDILICTSSGSKELVGKAAELKNVFSSISFGAFCKVIRINNDNNINKDYIRLFFKSKIYRKQISELSHGANISNIKTEDINNLIINIPEIVIQNNAVKEMNNIFNAIESKKKELINFDELIKSRFIEMFSEVSNKQMLSALTIKITDGSHNPPKGIEKSNYLMLSSQNVYDKLVLNDVRYLSKEDFNFENKRTNIQNGDVLLTIVGTVGRTYVVRNDEKYVFQRSVAVIKPIDGVLDGIYLSAYLKTEEAINQLEAGAHGSSQKGIYLNNLKKLVIPVADFSKQLTFKSFVNQVDKSKFIVQQQIKSLQELFDKKMDEYFGD